MVKFLSYAAALGIAWQTKMVANARVCTVGEHNSAVAMAASLMDMLSDPGTIAPKGSRAPVFPEQTYPGPIEQFAGKRVPIVGTYQTVPDGDRGAMFQAMYEALRLMSFTHPAPKNPPGTAPSGMLLSTAYPAGVLGVQGIGASLIYSDADPAATVDEDPAAATLARFMLPAMAIADKLTADSAAGRSVADSMGQAIAALEADATLADSTRATLRKASQYDTMRKNDAKRKKMIAAGFAGALLVGAVGLRMAVKKKSGAAGNVPLGKG